MKGPGVRGTRSSRRSMTAAWLQSKDTATAPGYTGERHLMGRGVRAPRSLYINLVAYQLS